MTEEDEIATHADAIELQASIAAVPDDAAPQLVLADLLQSAGDPRGELIVLDHLERTGGLDDRDALIRYLVLAAEYSFPRARPEAPPLPFFGYGSQPPRFTTRHAGRHYDVRYRDYHLEVIGDEPNHPVLSCRLDLCVDGNSWTADETFVILRLLGDAIRADTGLAALRFPFGRERTPLYAGGPLRGYRLPNRFVELVGASPDRYALAPRDQRRWLSIYQRLL